jgi:chorismate mutase
MYLPELNKLRLEQDDIDREIVQVLAKRYEMRKKISAIRIKNNLPTIDTSRRDLVLKQAEKYASLYHAPPKMVVDIFASLIDWSHRWDIEWRERD